MIKSAFMFHGIDLVLINVPQRVIVN